MQEFADQIGAVRHSTCTKLFFWEGFDQKEVCRPQSTTFGTTFSTNTEDFENLQQKTRFKIRQLWRMLSFTHNNFRHAAWRPNIKSYIKWYLMIKVASGSLEPSSNISLRHRGAHMKPELVGGCINHKPQVKASCKKWRFCSSAVWNRILAFLELLIYPPSCLESRHNKDSLWSLDNRFRVSFVW